MSGSSLDPSLGTTEHTQSSLHSMEELQFPARHFLADLSPSQLDRNFSESPNTSNRFSGTPSGDRSSNTPSSGDYDCHSTFNHKIICFKEVTRIGGKAREGKLIFPRRSFVMRIILTERSSKEGSFQLC